MNYKNIDLSDDDLIKILQHIGCTHITNGQNEIKFAWYESSNPNGACLFKNSFRYVYWSKNISGDLIDLIERKVGCNFIKAKNLISEITNKQYKDNIKTDDYINYVHKIKKQLLIKSYSLEEIQKYPHCISKLFIEDGIGLLAHYKFDIRFDIDSNRIVFPIRDIDGNLLGILGRYNKKNIDNNIPKYLSILPYERKYFLFGLYENKDYLKHTIILVESEKSVMRAFSMGYRNVVALGGLFINEYKLKMILKLKPKYVILALDEGLTDEYIIKTAKELKSPNPFIKWHVGYIPSNHIGLGNKNCIFDETKEKCDYILKNEIKYIC